MLEERMRELKQKLTAYATLVEQMIGKCLDGLVHDDRRKLNDVIGADEHAANTFEIELDELCTALIAQYQPAARELRTILMTLKMSNDLERMGDHAVNIAESGFFLLGRPPIKPFIDLPQMGKVVMNMVTDAVNSFITEDARLAKGVCERDSVVDALNERTLRELIDIMGKDASTVERAMHIMRIANNLERIADLSTNICEEVVFMVQGRIIKHHYPSVSSG